MTWNDSCQSAKGLFERVYPNVAQRSFMIWLLAASATIVSTNYLVHDKHQHFPYHILIPQVLVALAIHIFRLARRHGWNNVPRYFNDRHSVTDLLSPHKLWRGAYIGFAVLSLLSSYQSFFHLPSLLCLTMVLTLGPIAANLLSDFLLRPSKQTALRAVLITACVFAILWDDYRLTPNGISIILLAMGSYIALNVVREMYASYEDTIQQGRQSSSKEIVKVLAAALIPLLACTAVAERPKAQSYDSSSAPLALSLNALLGGIALATGGLLFAPLPSVGQTPPEHSKSSSCALAVLPMVAIGYSATGRRIVQSPWQVVFFLAAHVVQTSVDVDFTDLRTSMEPAQSYARSFTAEGWQKVAAHEIEAQESDPILAEHASSLAGDESDDVRQPAKTHSRIWHILRIALILLASVGWLLLLCHSFAEPPRLSGYYSTLDRTPGYEPLSTYSLDIVVSYHDEPINDLVRNLNGILNMPIISLREVRVFLYAKASSTPFEDLRTTVASRLPNTTTIIAADLPNIGREGGTYLSHILNRYDDLASHTLFVQAEMHNPWYMQARINQYYLPRTGFLSLSFMETFCDSCETCRDHSTWREDPAVLNDVYRLANNGSECKDLVLTYRGQFMASATRIQANDRAVYENLQKRFTNVFEETGEENPNWGYTLERLWGVVLRCPGRKRIADRCPSLASGLLGAVGAIDDCQCLDLDTQ